MKSALWKIPKNSGHVLVVYEFVKGLILQCKSLQHLVDKVPYISCQNFAPLGYLPLIPVTTELLAPVHIMHLRV